MVTLSPKLVMLTAASPLWKLVISAGRYPSALTHAVAPPV